MIQRLKLLALLIPVITFAQADNEIQVYASPITDKGATLFELHSNYTLKGIKGLMNSSSAKYLNETLEVTHGIDGKFELGFYFFTTLAPGGPYHFQGAQIRPRYTVPEKNNWPFGASISVEFGFFRAVSDSDFIWQGEIRPIIDKNFGNWYFSLNPNIDFAVTGDDKKPGIAPQFKSMYIINEKVGIGFEYYSSLGTFSKILPGKQQEHILGPAFDIFLHDDWKINFAFLNGLTPNTNQSVLKLHLGYRLLKSKVKK